MAVQSPKSVSAGSAMTVGIVVGFALGAASSNLLLLRLGGYFMYFLPLGLAPLAVGPIIGSFLAWAGFVPPLRLAPTLAIAIVVGIAPHLAGSIEVGLRDDPFPMPADAQAIHWTKYAQGERILRFGSPEAVPDLHDKLVLSSEEAGWYCHTCVYQSVTGTGYASFGAAEGGRLGFEVWPGEMALYGSSPSGLSQVRVFHEAPTRSPEWVYFGMIAILLVAMLFHFVRKPAPGTA